MSDIVEFYVGKDQILTVKSSHRLMPGELINISKVAYKVSQVTFAVDQPGDDPWAAKLVQAVFLVKTR